MTDQSSLADQSNHIDTLIELARDIFDYASGQVHTDKFRESETQRNFDYNRRLNDAIRTAVRTNRRGVVSFDELERRVRDLERICASLLRWESNWLASTEGRNLIHAVDNPLPEDHVWMLRPGQTSDDLRRVLVPQYGHAIVDSRYEYMEQSAIGFDTAIDALECLRDSIAANTEQSVVDAPVLPTLAPVQTARGEGDKPPTSRQKGIPFDEAKILVRDYLEKHAKDNPQAITRDAIAAATGVSAGNVSDTPAWIAFNERRKAEQKPRAREVPLSEKMEAILPTGNKGKANSVQQDAELAELIEEQNREKTRDENYPERRHKRRHGPS